MKRFLVTSFIFLAIFFTIDKLTYILISKSPDYEVDKRLELILEGKLSKDLIILGSSRGARSIIAKQLEDLTYLSSYNLSYPGSNVIFHEFILKSLLKFNNPPKMLVLVIDERIELMDSHLEFRFDRLYPLIKYEHINNELIERGEKNLFTKLFIVPRLSKQHFRFEKKMFSKLDSIDDCGSMPISFQSENTNFKFTYSNSYNKTLEDTERVNSFLEIQKICKLNDIKLLIVFPPNFKIHNEVFEDRIREVSIENTLYHVYDQENPKYLDSTYFYDTTHLKKNGAVIFTNETSKIIKEVLNVE